MHGSEVLGQARAALKREAHAAKAAVFRGFFKDTAGDVFLGVSAPVIRKIAKEFEALPLGSLQTLMHSGVHEERSLAHAILRKRFSQGSAREQEIIYKFYLKNRTAIRAWDGVDDSAPYIVGAYLLHREKSLLSTLARSERLWDRRIAIVSTAWFIRNGQTAVTFRIARMLLHDPEDLIHKATGWMLREAGKRDLPALKQFLKTHQRTMPRTVLRYAIERFPEKERRTYLVGKNSRPQLNS
ncbi:MAG TPA: DNA alkylation repair protein [Terriglobia bacterium]|nr:DNA alkylation repair protein [Terriglobia bacterium]